MRGGNEREAGVALRLEPSDEPLLLRFVEAPGGARAIYGEEDPAPVDCVERFLLQSGQDGKRRRVDGGQADAQAEDERVQALHENQRCALESLQRAGTVSELLQRSTWGQDDSEQMRFLHLHPAVQSSAAAEEAAALVQEREAAMASWPTRLREAGAAVAASQQHTELEGVLRSLRRHWLVHCVNGRYLVELWNESNMTKASDPKKGLAGKYLAVIGQHPQLGVCLTFPHEIGRLVEWRHRLAVRVLPLRVAPADLEQPARQAAPAPPPGLDDPNLPRGEAMHLVLTEAQEVLIDHCIFRRLREGLAQSDAGRWLRWHVLRASSSEIALAVPVGAAAELVHIMVSYGGAEQGGTRTGGRPDVWAWFGKAARLRLRELFLMGPSADVGPEAVKSPMSGEAKPSDLFGDFTRWLEPQLDAITGFTKGL